MYNKTKKLILPPPINFIYLSFYMAIIEKIRSNGKLTLVVVLAAIGAFVVQDWVSGRGNGAFSKATQQPIAEINGEKIDPQIYTARLADLKETYKEQGNNNPELNTQLEQQTWQELVNKYLFDNEYAKIGIGVGKKEIADMFYGQNAVDQIKQDQNFQDTLTRAFDPKKVKAYVATLDKNPQAKKVWLGFEKAIIEERKRNKYTAMLSKSAYITTADAKRTFAEQNTMVDVRVVSKKYASVADSTIQVGDADIQKYYDEHKHELVQEEETRKIKYAVANITPSMEDNIAAQQAMSSLKDKFAELSDETQLSAFVNMNSDNGYSRASYEKRSIPIIDSLIYKADKGGVFGPLVQGTQVLMVKSLGMKEFTDSIRASHILIDAKKMSTEEARKQLDSVKINVGKGMPFELAVMQLSDDPGSKARGGDLGFFGKGAMIPEFEKACLEAKPGELVFAETKYGVHLIKVTGRKLSNKPEVIVLARNISTSKLTEDAINKRIVALDKATDAASFDKLCKANQFTPMEQAAIRKSQKNIGAIQDASDLVKWSFTAPMNEVKDFTYAQENGQQIVVAIVAGLRSKGVPRLEEVKDDLKTLAKNDKKATTFIAEMSKAGTSLDAIASALNLKVDSVKNINMATYGVPVIGGDVPVLGKIMADKDKKGQLSKPVKGQTGVYVYEVVENRELQPAPADWKEERNKLNKTPNQMFQNRAFMALSKKANIVDNRYLY